MRNAPFAYAYVFCNHIAYAGLNHPHRSFAEHVEVTYNDVGAMTVNRDLQIVSDDGRGSGAVAVHRGRRADDNGRDVCRFGYDFAYIVYNAAAYADEKIAGRIVM